jgi:hypothetical protein
MGRSSAQRILIPGLIQKGGKSVRQRAPRSLCRLSQRGLLATHGQMGILFCPLVRFLSGAGQNAFWVTARIPHVCVLVCTQEADEWRKLRAKL